MLCVVVEQSSIIRCVDIGSYGSKACFINPLLNRVNNVKAGVKPCVMKGKSCLKVDVIRRGITKTSVVLKKRGHVLENMCLICLKKRCKC